MVIVIVIYYFPSESVPLLFNLLELYSLHCSNSVKWFLTVKVKLDLTSNYMIHRSHQISITYKHYVSYFLCINESVLYHSRMWIVQCHEVLLQWMSVCIVRWYSVCLNLKARLWIKKCFDVLFFSCSNLVQIFEKYW